MKKFLLFAFLAIFSFASVSYRSLHQYAGSFKDQFIEGTSNSYFQIKTPDLYYYSGYRIYPCQDSSSCTKWCSNDWMRYRLYVPTGAVDKLEILIRTSNNSSHYAMLYFVPDETPVQTVDFNTYIETYYVSDTALSALFKNGYQPVLFPVYNVKTITISNIDQFTNKSGWLYIAMAQADQVMASWNGYQSNPKLDITLTYYLKQGIDPVDYLKTKRFTSTGDPIENFASLTENSKLCSGQNVVVTGQNVGEYIFDPNKPSFISNVSKTTDGLVYDIEVKAGNVPLEGIAIEDNHNITLSMTLDSCLRLRSTSASKGTPFYSTDGQTWSNIFDPNTLYRFVKIEAASADSSSVVLNPQESLQWRIETSLDPNCIRSTIISSWQAHYILNGIKETTSKDVSYLIPVTTVYSSSSSSSTYTYVSSSVSTGVSADEDTPEKCADRGGVWLDSLGCSIPSTISTSSSLSSSSSSLVFSSSSTFSQTAEEDSPEACRARGGEWLDSLGCSIPPSSVASSETSSSSVSSSAVADLQSYKAELAKRLENNEYSIKGYYIQFDPDDSKFGWIYVSSTKNLVAKIEKPDNLDSYNWTILQNVYQQLQAFDDIVIGNDTITFGRSLVPFIAGQDNYKAELAKRLENNEYSIKGYYIQFDPDDSKFGWIYVSSTKNLVAKIEKPDNLDSYNWTILQNVYRDLQAFDQITVQDGKVVFGKSLISSVESSEASSVQSSVSSSSSLIATSRSSVLSSVQTDESPLPQFDDQ